ncbi:MAG: lamin tail domain-containing protein [Anaerolineales bacterium]|nr:lamin tail domain-containing protein [Anaerolineales bacterium]
MNSTLNHHTSRSAKIMLLTLAVFASGSCATTPSAAVARATAQAIVINEVLAHTDPPDVDSIELFNPGATPVDISGWYLSDDKKEPERFRIPSGTIVAAGGYHVFKVGNGSGELPFALSEFGEPVLLHAPGASGDLQLVDAIEFGASPNGVALGRYTTSTGAVHFPLLANVTLGAANALPRVGPVVINELMYAPSTGPEYLVLTNITDYPVQLFDPAHPENTWQVRGIGDKNEDYALPQDFTLGARASVILTADPDAYRAIHDGLGVPVVGPFPGKLSNEGERIALLAPQPPESDKNYVSYYVVDEVSYGVALPWPPAAADQGDALQRIRLDAYGDDPINWRAGVGSYYATDLALLPQLLRPASQ